MQAKTELEEYLNNSLVKKLIKSSVPAACKQGPCILGIDEAGRGPVLGPMPYAVAYYPQRSADLLAKMKFADSKVLSESVREELFEKIQTTGQGFQDLGYIIMIIPPNTISNLMLRRNKYNLNELSHKTAIDLIQSVKDQGIKIEHIYIDTVGPIPLYQDKLRKIFPEFKGKITVSEKADSKYPIVSAASVCAKVMRDRIVQNWKFIEGDNLHLDAYDLGSGYPSDPKTVQFLERSIDPVFGFPTLARFSWGTIDRALEKKACKCIWDKPKTGNSKNQKEIPKQQSKITSFFNVKARSDTDESIQDSFFKDRFLTRETDWNW